MKIRPLLIIVLMLIAFTGLLVDGSRITINQDRPNFKYQQNNHVSSGRVIFGNNSDSRFEMLSTKFTTTNAIVTLIGNPTVEELSPFRLNISGSFNMNTNINSKVIGSYFEVNDYLDEYNELERYRITDNQHYVESDNNFQTQFNLFKLDYSFFNNNDSYTKVEDQRSGITAFILRRGSIDNIRLNDTEGNEIGQVFSFRINVTIFYFTTGSHLLQGIYQNTDFGYGNIIPESIISYLRSTDFARRLNHGSIGEKLFENYRFSNIEWIDSGFNSTIGLDIYTGLYFYSRATTSLVFDPTIIPQVLTLNQIEDEFEQFQNDLIDVNLIDAFSDEMLNVFENELSNGVLDQGGVTMLTYNTFNESTKEIPNLKNLYDENIFFITQFAALLIVTTVLIRRKKNSY